VAVSIKVRESTKRRLERLKSDLASRGAGDISMQGLLEAIVAVAEEVPARVYAEVTGPKLPVPPAVRERVLSFAFDWGVETTEEDIDRTLYSDEAIHGKPPRPPKRRK
jgi:hypothetical protein